MTQKKIQSIMERKNVFMCVCTFVCGLIIGGGSVYLMIRPDTSVETEDVATENVVDYAQVYGIDVSFWQGNILWDQLCLPCEEDGSVNGRIPAPRHQRPVQFAFIRATKSSDIVDTLYQRNYEEAKRQGIACGAYHFLTDTVAGKVQAELFLSNALFQTGDLPPVLDVETDSPAIVEAAKEWLAIVEKHCGVKAILYTNTHVYEKWIKNDETLGARDLWLARPQDTVPTDQNWTFWQFTHKGHIWGVIDNVVDINMFNGTQEDLLAYIDEKGIKER